MTRLKTKDIPLNLQFQTEASLREEGKKLAEKEGYEIRSLSLDKKLPKQWHNLGDWLIRNPSWEAGRWVMVEFKNGLDWHWSSDEQEQAYHEGKIVVFWWLEDLERWIAADKRRN